MGALYDMYGGMAFGLAHRTLGATSEAEDVVQEAFLALWRQARRLDPARGLKSYLLTIVHNKAIDRLRQRGRRAETALDNAGPIQAESGDPVVFADLIADRDLVRTALDSLPKEQRQTVELTYFGGLTTTEVAERTRVPIGTVKSRLRLTLGHMRRRLEESTWT